MWPYDNGPSTTQTTGGSVFNYPPLPGLSDTPYYGSRTLYSTLGQEAGGLDLTALLAALSGQDSGGYQIPFSQTQAGMQMSGQQGLDLQSMLGQQGMEQINLQAAHSLTLQQLAQSGAIDLQRLVQSGAIDLETLRQSGNITLQELIQGGAIDIEKMRQSGALDVVRLQQAGAEKLQAMAQEFQLKQQEKELGFRRQELVGKTMGTDPVRALLYALGVGGSILPGGESFAGLGPMQGAQEYKGQTIQALQGLLSPGKFGVAQTPGSPIDIGEKGVTGLASPEQAARAFQESGGAGQTLLASAYGVGNQALGGGLSAEEFVRRIQEVTPTGVLS